MKRWYVDIIYSGESFICSLREMSAKNKSCLLISDCGSLVEVYFNQYHKFDYAMAKSGVEIEAKTLSTATYKKVNCKIIFK